MNIHGIISFSMCGILPTITKENCIYIYSKKKKENRRNFHHQLFLYIYSRLKSHIENGDTDYIFCILPAMIIIIIVPTFFLYLYIHYYTAYIFYSMHEFPFYNKVPVRTIINCTTIIHITTIPV